MEKRLNILLYSILFVLGLSTNAFAQKYGYMNYNNLIVEMADTKAADAALVTYQKQLSAQLEKKGKALMEKFSAAQKDAQDGVLPPVKIREMEAQLEEEQQQLEAEQADAQEKVLAKREALFQPIFKKVNDAIEAVGKENGYTFIFNESTGAILFNVEADDVTPLVKSKLGNR